MPRGRRPVPLASGWKHSCGMCDDISVSESGEADGLAACPRDMATAACDHITESGRRGVACGPIPFHAHSRVDGNCTSVARPD
jgi:hypothetical protein